MTLKAATDDAKAVKPRMTLKLPRMTLKLWRSRIPLPAPVERTPGSSLGFVAEGTTPEAR